MCYLLVSVRVLVVGDRWLRHLVRQFPRDMKRSTLDPPVLRLQLRLSSNFIFEIYFTSSVTVVVPSLFHIVVTIL